MAEKIKAIIDAVTDKVLGYRPVDKGLAAKNPMEGGPVTLAIQCAVRLPDARYIHLHQLCAAGTITEDELAELDLMCAMKEAEFSEPASDACPLGVTGKPVPAIDAGRDKGGEE